MTLHELNATIEDALARAIIVDVETGEVLGMDMSEVDSLQLERTEKLQNIALAIKNAKSDLAQLKEEKKNISTRIDSYNSRIESMSNWLQYNLAGEKINTPKVVVSYRTSKVVEVNEDLLPDEWWRVKVDREPDKTAIKAAITSGTEVCGAVLTSKVNMTIK